MLIGYVRVSTSDQNLSLQKEALIKAGCEKIFEDQMSGTKDNRPGLNAALEILREDDILVVWKLDRLGRSVKSLITLVNDLNSRSVKSLITLVNDLNSNNIHFKSLTDSIDTSTTAGRFFFNVMASLAQMERELIVERTKAGLDAAKKQGRVGGRKKVMTDSKLASAKKLLNSGIHPKIVAKDLGVSLATLYRWIPAG